MPNKIYRMTAIGGILLSFLTGCQVSNQPPANEASPPPNQKISYTQRVEQTQPQRKYNHSSQAVANRMVEIAAHFPQIRNATAISIGPYTLVGIDVDPTLDRGRVGTLKYALAEALREDPQGSQALITADVDLTQRIRELNEEVKNGRPVHGVMRELADIVARISPQPTKDVEKRERPQSEVNQQRLNESTNVH